MMEILQSCIIFKGLTEQQLRQIMNEIPCNRVSYSKDELVAVEGDDCKALGIVIEGAVEVQKVYASGKTVSLTRIQPGGIFGEALVFSQSRQYPATITALKATKVIFFAQKDIVGMCSRYTPVLQNFMALLSNKLLMLNRKVRELSFETIRQKVCNYLVEQHQVQHSLTIKDPYSRRVMAEHMGVQRPSLSRELGKMQEEGLIEVGNHKMSIKNLAAIEEYLV